MSDAKEILINEIAVALTDNFPELEDTENGIRTVHNLLAVTMARYNVEEVTTDIVVYHGSVNDELIKKFIVCKKVQGCSKRTLQYYQSTLYFFFKRVPKSAIEITTDDIRVYLAFREMRDRVSITTRNNERRVFYSFYTWMRREGIRIDNPVEAMGPIKKVKKKKRAFSEMEIERLRMACETPREKFLLEFLLSTGCRASEVSQALLSDIEGDQLVVHGKGAKDRYVFLNAKTLLTMENYLEWRKERFGNDDINPHLFRPDQGGNKHALVPLAVSGIEIVIRNLGKKAGVENTHPHRFRRTCATRALRTGMPIELVSMMLGHNDISTTQIYLDIDEDSVKTAHKKYVV